MQKWASTFRRKKRHPESNQNHFTNFPATPQHGSFDLGVHIPISDVGSEMEINLEDDEVEVENDEFDNDVDGDGGA